MVEPTGISHIYTQVLRCDLPVHKARELVREGTLRKQQADEFAFCLK